jgi:hypothetical protein
MALATASFGVFTYNDGKFSLLQANKEEEWEIVKQGCEREMWCNMWKAATFPTSFLSGILPNIIIYFNKPR